MTTTQPALFGLTRVASGRELYEDAYRGDGSCRCGGDRWRLETWVGGFWVTCQECGWWECHHELRGVRHTSDGKWLASGPNCRAPEGCPLLSEGQETGTHSVLGRATEGR